MNLGLPVLAYALLLAGSFGLACTVLGNICVQAKLWSERRRARRDRDAAFTPPISVLKPLKGVDDDLLANLTSLAEQDYPEFELLIAIDDFRDPALAQARLFQRLFPDLSIRIVVRRNRAGLNPKVNNLLSALQLARHEHLLISDSNVSLDRGYLRAVVAPLADRKVGLVSSLIAGAGERTFGAALENLQLNTFVATGVCAGAAFEHPIVVGKSMLLRRSDLDRLGGLRSVRDVLAEDYVLGRAFHEAGMRVVLSGHRVCSINRDWSLRQFLARHLRWGQMRRFGHPLAFAFEPLLFPVPWLLAAAVVQLMLRGPGPLAAAALGGVLIKMTSDLLLVSCLRGRPSAALALLAPVKDCMIFALWPVALLRRKVVWRGNRLRIGPGTRLIGTGADEGVALSPAQARGDLV